MSNVVSLRSKANKDVVEAVEQLRIQAISGSMQGLMFVASTRQGHHSGMCGSYRDDPALAVSVANGAMQQLYSYEARKRMDPLTASEIFSGWS